MGVKSYRERSSKRQINVFNVPEVEVVVGAVLDGVGGGVVIAVAVVIATGVVSGLVAVVGVVAVEEVAAGVAVRVEGVVVAVGEVAVGEVATGLVEVAGEVGNVVAVEVVVVPVGAETWSAGRPSSSSSSFERYPRLRS